jgi:dTDP-4-amino-4,6-dideoxygalactose transaminase
MINVTKTPLPPIEEYIARLRGIWDRRWITNHGQLVQELEQQLQAYLEVERLTLVSNGTSALQVAIQALGIKGDVITTPFSYVATTGSILWQGCRPVFVDIEDRTFCIDPDLIEAAITPQTTAIVATHVYGYPCDVTAIEAIAKRRGLKIIYDGAQSFGTRLAGRSLAIHGDATTYSFHATKLFHTVEGGGLATNNAELAEQFELTRAFGQRGEEQLTLGMNAKMSEFHAAMGLCLLPGVPTFIEERRRISAVYDKAIAAAGLSRPTTPETLEYNYAYYPVIFPSESELLSTQSRLTGADIHPRRYFRPSLNCLPYVHAESCPISEDITSRVLCLPLYSGITENDIQRILSLVSKG